MAANSSDGNGGFSEMLVVRPATPDDAGAVSDLIYLADTGHRGVSGWDLISSGSREKAMEMIRWVYLNGYRTGFHYSRFLVGAVEGTVIGAVSYLVTDDYRLLNWWKTFREMGESRLGIAVIAWKMLPFLLVNPSVPKGTLAVESAAIFPEHRGREIAEEGLRQAFAKAINEGYVKIQIAIVIGNDAPRKVCERMGFKVTEEKRSRLFERKFGAPGMMRLVFEVPQDSSL